MHRDARILRDLEQWTASVERTHLDFNPILAQERRNPDQVLLRATELERAQNVEDAKATDQP